MKKFRLMLTAAAVFSVVGTALALNSSVVGDGDLFCRSNNAQPSSCSQDPIYEVDTNSNFFRLCGTTRAICTSTSAVSTEIDIAAE